MRLGRLAAVLLALALVGSLTTSASADDRWVFYSKDRHHYTSPWFAGAHRIMIPFGCTAAPYYSPDPRCRDDHGFHHGIDIAMPCGTRLFAAVPFRVMSNDSLGSAYGVSPLLLRNRIKGWDLVIGHTRKVYVREGQRVKRGTVFARANDSGAPDGCHLHFERRAAGGGLSTAVKPRELLDLTPRKRS
jgi:murein DD-endopeptidase MepM/ murein hydrolase activator NlpD